MKLSKKIYVLLKKIIFKKRILLLIDNMQTSFDKKILKFMTE